ncbi:MAG: M16 family metallopeptidase, partial [Longimicrobiales bacterium]
MAAPSILTRLPTHERQLDNGLRVLVREDHSSPVVSIVTHVSAGYFDEPDALVGISHVLEHMFFKGTERRGVGTIARDTKAAGGYLNAGTIYDRTTYYTTLPADALEEGLDIQADALRNSVIDADELERELLVIIQEAKRKLDSPSAVATETLFEVMFDVHRMRRWRIGQEEGLRRLRRADVVRFYRALYRASNIVLVVAGDVRPEHVFARVERLYGDMPAGDPVRDPSPAEPQRSGLRLRELTGDVAHAYVEWGFRTPGTLHPDTPLLDLLSVVLGQGRASRLYRGVRERGLVSAISAQNYTPTEIGVFGVSAEADAGDVPAALRAIRAEVLAVAEAAPGEAELERARNILEARLIRRLETTDGQATLLAEWEALGDWRRAGEHIERALDATPQDLRRVAHKYLGLDHASLVVYRPEGSAPVGRDACELRADLADVSAAAGVPAAQASEAPGITVTSEPAPSGANAAPSEEVVIERLPNGVRVVIAPRRAAPLVSIAVACRGGGVFETEERAGITMLMARASVKGTTTRTAARLAEETEALGGAIGPAVSADACTWGLSLPSRHFERGMTLLADVILNATFPRLELDRERDVALRDLGRLRDDMHRYPGRLFAQAAYPDHPYGFAVETIEAALRGLGRSDVAEWHGRHVLNSRPWAFVVGDVDVAAALAAVERELGALTGS